MTFLPASFFLSHDNSFVLDIPYYTLAAEDPKQRGLNRLLRIHPSCVPDFMTLRL